MRDAPTLFPLVRDSRSRRAMSNYLLYVVAAAATIAVVLWLIQHAYARGYAEGLANAQIEPATRLISAPVARQILAMEFAAAERGRPLTVVVFSIDNFRRLAPIEGGAVGNRILLSTGAILRRRTRGMNVSARFDDAGMFFSVLGGVTERGAGVFLGRVMKDLGSIATGYQPLSVSTSVCEYRPSMDSVDELMQAGLDGLAPWSSRSEAVAYDAL